jgi:glyoxylase-like metal-dependent hydrolase (beta-lactamase superfamily II)
MTTWTIGDIELQRVSYFDIGLDAGSIGLDGVAPTVPWADVWLTDGAPAVGQAFWIIRSGRETLVVDPCGASDAFLRSGPDGLVHQQAAFELFEAAGCSPSEVTGLVLTHLDGIGMAALSDGAAAGSETWSPAFENAPILISQPEYEAILAHPAEFADVGGAAFAQLCERGVVQPVDVPHQLAAGVTLRPTMGHSAGHCVVDIESGGQRAVLVGHLAISPLHAAAGLRPELHRDGEVAWREFDHILRDAAEKDVLVVGVLWPEPGAARVTGVDPFTLVPAEV